MSIEDHSMGTSKVYKLFYGSLELPLNNRGHFEPHSSGVDIDCVPRY